MSGFGGGFGVSPGFGQSQHSTTTPGAFGTSAGFGASGYAAPASFAGSPPPVTFGSSQNVSTTAFGGSGFGTGTGPTQNGGFGSTMATPSHSAGFGTATGASSGFGSSSNSNSNSYGAVTSVGFGSSINTGFGSASTSSSGGFGNSSTVAGLGNTTSGAFGSAPATFGNAGSTNTGEGLASTTGATFGSNISTTASFGTASTSTFGASASSGGFGSGFGTSQPPSSGGFGMSNNSTGGSFAPAAPIHFGSTQAPASSGFAINSGGGFGTSSGGAVANTLAPSSGGFGTHSGVTFGSAPAPVSGFGTSFGTATSTSTVIPTSGFGSGSNMAFGASSNVITGSSSIPRFGQPTTGGSTGWNSKPSTNPFGSPLGDDGMMMADDALAKQTHGDPKSTTTASNMAFGRSNNQSKFRSHVTAIAEESEMGDDHGTGNDHYHDGNDSDTAATTQRANEEARLKAKIEEKKRILQAKIEEKRKKLEEKQRQKKEQSPTPELSMNPNAPAFHPSNKTLAERNAVRFGDQDKSSAERNVPRFGDQDKSLAERNAARFGEQDRSATREMLPPEMRAKADQTTTPPVVYNTSDQQRSTEREDLKTAKALVGTCEFFCPDEELLRREREGDIQQLEIPLPGKLHPADWTLRQTAVKRFRRSAADYKLDVPEWVRPPDVLEQVCGYLEEWVMERDRQGPDPRFPQGQTPPPLEVYQFIWDRTRMIRKDFTLQNYVGTGGKCDARAVRCHERIARWHAMCEHQLSHIPEFVTMQSQQNIQELGQTMKTLNQFYDDSLNRSTVEVPDDDGRETRHNLSGFSHGCSSNKIEGNAPLDFDGSALNNSAQESHISRRIIGEHAVKQLSHGTAEPEMRGLYMLLTMNNEGGMEVLKYAAKLFQERPEIYHSKPVQLALEIFKAKKEYNYARFFSILRAPTTPYLFCCIMFKHVELMRKIAFRIMGKAFGARKKDTGEAIYDAYPLNRLIELLCFEDVDEARVACQHYNITVKQVQVSASQDEVADVIFWRASEFKEPTHPEKGFVLPLQPKKMTRIIERKLQGATRLAVCRGEVSGEGATLGTSSTFQAYTSSSSVTSSQVDTTSPIPSVEEDRAKAAALLKRQQMAAANLEQEALLRQQERQRIEKEQKKEEEERLKREAEERKAKELEKERVLKALELKQREAEVLEAKRLKEQAEKQALEERLRKEARRRELEEESKRKEQEAMQQAEEARRQADEARRREEAKLVRQNELRLMEEKRRLEEAKNQERMRRELEAKRQREAEEYRKSKEWEDKANTARKHLLWRRWQNRVSRSLETTQESAASLRKLDPTFLSHTLNLGSWLQKLRGESDENSEVVSCLGTSLDMIRLIEYSIRDEPRRVSLSELIVREMTSSQKLDTLPAAFKDTDVESKVTLLLKVALFIPSYNGMESDPMVELLKKWIHYRLGLDEVITSQSSNNRVTQQLFEARSTVHYCRNAEDSHDCDVALVVIPPPWSTSDERRRVLRSICCLMDDSMPRVALTLGDFDHEGHEYMKSVLAEALGPSSGTLSIICNRNMTPVALEKALELSCKKLASIFVNETCVKIDRMSIPKLASSAISTYLWKNVSPHLTADGNFVLETARSAISAIIEEASLQVQENENVWSTWPPKEFVSENGVECYFSKSSHLPIDWKSSLRCPNFVKELEWLSHELTGSFRDVVESLLFEAPKATREQCGMMISKGYFRRCLQAAIDWFAAHTERHSQSFVYFPRGLLEVILDQLAAREQGKVANDLIPGLLIPQDTALLDAVDEIDQTMFGMKETMPIKLDERSVLKTNHGTNKRRRHDACSTRGPSSTPECLSQSEVDFAGNKKPRSSDTQLLNANIDIKESLSFSKRLEELMKGATVDLEIGDLYLSNILRQVPEINMD